MLNVTWFGYGGSSNLAEDLRPVIEQELQMKLTTIHEWENADIKWELKTWAEHLKKADIVICPANWEVQPAKSANRLCQSMAFGKPVICSPLDAYMKVVEKHPGCCLIADSKEEWKEKLQLLRDDESLRKETSQKALIASQDASIDNATDKWLGILEKREGVDIVIPTYKNLRGLKLCLESIRECTEVLYTVIVVNNGTDEELNKYLEQQADIVYIRKDRLNFAQAVNTGIKAGKSKYVMILNDDVIVSKGWLKTMVDSCIGDVGVVGPLSNCDMGWLHEYKLYIGGIALLPGTNSFGEIESILNLIYNYESPYDETHEREWLALYCTLIRRDVLNDVGLMDEKFTNSGEDVDLCRRIGKMGYKIIQNFNSFVFHFGAVSRKLLEQENKGSYQEADKNTNLYLNEKWGKKTVLIYSGPSWEAWSPDSLDSGIGGSEVWQIWLARRLVDLGYRVVSFADTRKKEFKDGEISWIPYTDYPKWIENNWVDYAILSRTTDPLRFHLRAGKVFIQIHDVWMLSQKDQLFLDKVDKYCALSQWHLDFAADYHKIPLDKMAITANGIEFDRFDGVEVERNPYRFHWSSSWDRGLDNILYMWQYIIKEFPEAELHVYYGCLNWYESCKQRNDQAGLKKIEEMKESMKQPGVFNHGRKNQKELAVEIKKASVLFYPGMFSETFFIGGVEAQRAGVPVIANDYAGVKTSLGDSAILLGDGKAWWPYSKEGRESFLNEVISLLKDKEKWQEWSDKGFKNSEKYSWAKVAERWHQLFRES